MARHCLSRPSFSVTSPSASPPKCARRMEYDAFSLDDFVSHVYMPHASLRKRSPQMDERIARQHISLAFGDRRLADIDRTDVEGWLHDLSVQGLAPATCNRILAVFKSICSLATIHGLFPAGQSPCADVPPFKSRTAWERYLAQQEARRLMGEFEQSERQEAKALVCFCSPARKSEILKACWENIRLEQRLLSVPVSKSGKPRHISLSDEAVEVIRSIPRVPSCPWFFPGHAPGKPLSDIYMFWNRLRRGLGLADVRIHDLRHTFASVLVNAGHSLYEVQKLLGHSDPRTTMRYAQLGQASLLAAAQTVSAYLARSSRGGRSRNVVLPLTCWTCKGRGHIHPRAAW